MKNDHLLQALADMGLTENESRVYLSAIILGPSTILQIARHGDMKRTTVYAVVDSLQAKGLFSTEIRGFKTIFVPEDPEQLLQILKKKEEQLKSSLPDLSILYNKRSHGSVIKHYEGIEGVKVVYENILKDLTFGSEYSAITDVEKWLAVDPAFFEKFRTDRAKILGITTRTLLADNAHAHDAKKAQKNNNVEVRILPKKASLTTNVIMTDKYLVIQQLTAPFSAIVIENQEALATQKEMFDILWATCDETDLG